MFLDVQRMPPGSDEIHIEQLEVSSVTGVSERPRKARHGGRSFCSIAQ